MPSGAFISGLLHLVLLALVIFGLPLWFEPDVHLQQVTVQMVAMAEVAPGPSQKTDSETSEATAQPEQVARAEPALPLPPTPESTQPDTARAPETAPEPPPQPDRLPGPTPAPEPDAVRPREPAQAPPPPEPELTEPELPEPEPPAPEVVAPPPPEPAAPPEPEVVEPAAQPEPPPEPVVEPELPPEPLPEPAPEVVEAPEPDSAPETEVAALPALPEPVPVVEPEQPETVLLPVAPSKPPVPEKMPEPESAPEELAPAEAESPEITEPETDFTSVLEELASAEPDARPAPSEAPQPAQPQPPQPAAESGPPLTMSELDAIKAQIESCWSLPASVKGAANADFSVEVVVELDQVGNVLKSEPMDPSRMADPVYEQVARSIIRATQICSPLKNLPASKFATWREIKLKFNLKEYLGT